MPLSDTRIIARSLRSRPVTTATTVASVGVAVGLVLLLVSLQGAAEGALRRGAGNAHLLLSRDTGALTSVLNGVFYANPPSRAMRMSEYDALLTRPRAPGPPLEAYVDWAIPTAIGDTFRGDPVVATTPEFFTSFEPAPGEPWAIDEGRMFEANFEMVVGAQIARRFDLNLGDQIVVVHGASRRDQGGIIRAGGQNEAVDESDPSLHTDTPFTIVGIMKPTATPHDRVLAHDLESTWILHAYEARGVEPSELKAGDLIDRERLITGALIRVATREGADASAALPVAFEMIRRDPGGFTVASPVDQINRLFRIVADVNLLLMAVTTLAALSGVSGVALAMINSMSLRRRQIAVLRVLGASRGRVFSLIITESAIIGAIGAVVGVAIAAVGLRLSAGFVRAQLGLAIPTAPDWQWAIPLIASAVLLSALAGLGPALMAYRTSVLAHLKPLG